MLDMYQLAHSELADPQDAPLPVAVKPPTQIAGIAGIGAMPITMNEAPLAPQLDWQKMVGLPPFQMYCAERQRNTTGKDSLGHAVDIVHQAGGGQDLFDAYCAWHAAKGYWPLETPMGELR